MNILTNQVVVPHGVRKTVTLERGTAKQWVSFTGHEKRLEMRVEIGVGGAIQVSFSNPDEMEQLANLLNSCAAKIRENREGKE